jgi:ubiquinone biosynthesis protein
MATHTGDLALGAFHEGGPWQIEPDNLTWRVGLDRLRARTRGEVPDLVTPQKLPPAARMARTTVHLGRAMAGWYFIDRRRGQSRAGLSRRFHRAFEALGPTYIKLGQIISSGEGIFPEELVSEFRLLRDRVAPETFADVRRTVEDDLGRPLEAVFARFEPEPLAAASIAQVHAAQLLTGEEVVVKVQRPQVARLVRRDLRVMAYLAPHLVGRIPVAALANPPALVELFAETIMEELDFRLEAENMLDLAAILGTTKARAIVVPRPHPTLVTRRVLVMERLSGFAFDDVEGMRAAGIDTEAVVRAGLVATLEGAVLYGVFHGDLHGGNLFVLPDGRTALLDYGITGRLDEPRRLAFLRLLMGAIVNDIRMQLEAFRDLGALPADTDLEAMIVDLDLEGPVMDPTLMSADELVNEIREIMKKLLSYGARMPKELMLFVKDLLFLNGAIATLAPDIDILGEITGIAEHFATLHGDRIMRDIGIDPRAVRVDHTGFLASVGIAEDREKLTFRELQDRRDVIRQRMEARAKKR